MNYILKETAMDIQDETSTRELQSGENFSPFECVFVKEDDDNDGHLDKKIKIETVVEEIIDSSEILVNQSCVENKTQLDRIVKKEGINIDFPYCVDENKNSVDDLLKNPFSRRTPEEVFILLNILGRPTPDLKIVHQGKSSRTMYVNCGTYREIPWLCGCPIRNALFCFPCLILGGEGSWSNTGVKDFIQWKFIIKEHSRQRKHIMNILELIHIRKRSRLTQSSLSYITKLRNHNELADKKRCILSKLIDSIRLCDTFELASKKCETFQSTVTPIKCNGIIDLMSSVDAFVKKYLSHDSLFQETSKTIQTELLKCMFEVCREEIIKEINNSHFVAIITDSMVDVSGNLRTVLIVRYIYCNRLYERFWTSLEELTTANLANCIHLEIVPLQCPKDKIIAQSYDGTALLYGVRNSIQAVIRATYPHAKFVHYYFHNWNMIFIQCASENKDAREFFSTLEELNELFINFPNCQDLLEETKKIRDLPSSFSESWTIRFTMVNIVYENRKILLECFEKLINPCFDKVHKARWFIDILQDKKFNFWLEFFHRLIPHSDLFNQNLSFSHSVTLDVKQNVNNFLIILQTFRNEIYLILRESDKKQEIITSTSKEFDSRMSSAKEVCDLIITQVTERFESAAYFEIASLLDWNKFAEFRLNFPDRLVEITICKYPFLQYKRLRTELSVIYDREGFGLASSLISIMHFIVENNIEETFQEVIKLLRILITTPMITKEKNRCVSPLKKIKYFLKNTICQDHINAFTMLTIEREIMNGMSDFTSKVVEKFVTQEKRKMEFKKQYLIENL